MTNTERGALSVPDQPIVAFYLTQETDLPAKFQGEHQITIIDTANPLGQPGKKPALRVTFPHNQPIEELVGLVAFGSDAGCHVLLPVENASPVHCRVFAQLNSGAGYWVIDDSSTQGTLVEDNGTSVDNRIRTIHRGRQAVKELRAIRIGPYSFKIRLPVSDAEVRRREDWFRLKRPIPVTRSMLFQQLGSYKPDWLQENLIGEGGYGKVYKYMEKHTALYVAVKREEMKDFEAELKAKKEIEFMEALHHVSPIYRSMTSTKYV